LQFEGPDNWLRGLYITFRIPGTRRLHFLFMGQMGNRSGRQSQVAGNESQSELMHQLALAANFSNQNTNKSRLKHSDVGLVQLVRF